MATKPKKDAAAPVKSSGTAVAKAKVALPVNIAEIEANEIAEYQKRLQAPTGNRIAVTQSKTFKLPNGEESDVMEGVIIDFLAANYYYPDAFERGNITPPACFALGMEPTTLAPSDSSPEKQADACAGCWANQFGSSGKGKACQNTRLLAVIAPDGDPEAPIFLMKVSPTALKAFDGYVGSVARNFAKPVRAVVTRFSFSEDTEYASMRFATVGPASKDVYALATSRLQEARDILTAEPDYSSYVKEEKAAPKAKKAVLKAPAKRK